eukprot:3213749-Prorocentrum_lima.AAC.1
MVIHIQGIVGGVALRKHIPRTLPMEQRDPGDGQTSGEAANGAPAETGEREQSRGTDTTGPQER